MFPAPTQHPLVITLQQHPFGSPAWLAAAKELLGAVDPELADWQESVRALVASLQQG